MTRKPSDHESRKGRPQAVRRNQSSKTHALRTIRPSTREGEAQEKRRSARRGYSITEERRARELNHRLRNVFSTVLTIVKHTAAGYPEATEYRDALERRLRALSAAMALLDRSESGAVSIGELIRLELAPFQDGDNVLISGPDVSIHRVHAQDFAIVLHELTTNAVKYGALSDLKGKLSVTWNLSTDDHGRALCLEWVEQGGPSIAAPEVSGFGMAVIRESGSFFGGSASVEFPPKGLRYRLSIPANRLFGVSKP